MARPLQEPAAIVGLGTIVQPRVAAFRRRGYQPARMAAQRELLRAFVNRLSLDPATLRGDLEALAKVVTESCSTLLGLERVGVWLFDESETELHCFDQFNLAGGTHESGAVLREPEFEPEFRALKTSLYVDASDPLTDPRTAGYVEGYLKPNRITSMLDLVIRFGGKNLGTLCFEHVDMPHAWRPEEIDFGLLVCAQLSVLLERREVRRTEAARREIEERLSATLESIGEGVIGTNTAGQIVDLNAVAARLTGWSLEEARGRRLEDVLDLDRAAPPGSASFEAVLRAKDGGERRVASDRAEIRLDNGAIIGWVVVVRDLTDEQRMREELLRARRLESIGLLAGGVAHDLNNMLSPILLLSARLLESADTAEPIQTHLETIRDSAARASGVTRQLLAFARKQPMAFRPIELNEVVVEFLRLFSASVRENVELQIALAEGEILISGDDVQIEQVLLNLVMNAQDAMPRGGTLAIATSQDAPHAVLTVSDTGSGMDAATVEHIFDPFFTTKSQLGTGLGLATAYGIVRQHGGTIDVESRPGEGTTFRVQFPLLADVAPGPATPSPSDEEDARLVGTETVLLVEDEEPLCALVADLLARHGYHVLQATKPETALALAEGHEGTIDLLLTDVVMPGMNGKELYARLVHSRPSLRVVYVSGYEDSVIAEQGILESGVILVAKPFSPREMLRKLREALDR
jgi:PAS domain S-box-containing protein